MGDVRFKMYYVAVELKDGSQDFICAPSGYMWTEAGIVKDGTNSHKSGPEMTKKSYKRHIFDSLAKARIQANKVNGAKIFECK